MSAAIEEVSLPPDALVAQCFPRPDYVDAFRAPLSDPADVAALTRLFFATAPAWITALFALRNRLVRLLGLKTGGPAGEPSLARMRFVPGERVGLFRVYARDEREILMGEDDRHLDFRVSILSHQLAGRQMVTLATVVRLKGWSGRAYFALVKPFHRLIVRAMLRRMVAARAWPADQPTPQDLG